MKTIFCPKCNGTNILQKMIKNGDCTCCDCSHVFKEDDTDTQYDTVDEFMDTLEDEDGT